jgi:hypothetical protein
MGLGALHGASFDEMLSLNANTRENKLLARDS